jgi:RNA polymerase sigma factor (TIGR02999 family)
MGLDRDRNDITALLHAAGAGDDRAREQVAELIYAELRRVASNRMRAERPNHTLSPTALANEAWLKLCDIDDIYVDRAHFLAVAANAMRRVLIDYARSRNAGKRRAGIVVKMEDIDADIAAPGADEHLTALDEALSRLAEFDPRAAKVVELRYFGGLTHSEIAELLCVDRRTVDRDWAAARAWLLDRLVSGSAT